MKSVLCLSFRSSASFIKTSITALAVSLAASAQAGDTPLYESAPDWIELVDLEPIEADEANDLIVFDEQVRIEEGRRWDYQDKVFRIDAITDLSKAGLLKVQWLPDKGDFIVHEISIVRDGALIDVVADGAEFEVLRRERQLERGILDGLLTATLTVPGLELNDQLRFRYSVTTSDQALGKEVQSQTYLRRKPRKSSTRMRMPSGTKADFSRVRVSWPEDLDVHYQAGPNYELGQPEKRDGFNWLEVVTPLPEADRIPPAAPLRYRRPTILQVSTFADWAEVSNTMAPYYEVDGSLGDHADLAAQVDAIDAQSVSEKQKAIDALELVQEEIRYLMNGLDGGNYLPQDVTTTWEMKYGDCKAKTVLLLAVLDRLSIEAEAVLVSTNRGNAVPASLPLPGAFNHVLVRATIDGQEYFLDGTSIGANIKTIGNVPPFEYYLPIRDAGAGLVPITQSLPRVAEQETHFEVDGSAGADLPTLATVRFVMVGAGAARLNAESDQALESFKSGYANRLGRGSQVIDVKIEEGEDDSEAMVIIQAIMPSLFRYEGTRGLMSAGGMTQRAKFSPNRSLKQWRDIPVAVGRPNAQVMSFRANLPFEASAVKVEGELGVDAEAGGKSFLREVDLEGSQVHVFEQQTTHGGEIPPDQIREERSKAARVVSSKLTLVAPPDAPRRWRFADESDRSALEPLEGAMAQIIAEKPDEAAPYTARAQFRESTYDFSGALEDVNKAIEIEATARLFAQRGFLHAQTRDLEAARADFEEAYLLDPTPTRAMRLGDAMANLGEVDEALELIQLETGTQKNQQDLAVAIAELEALQGDAQSGLSRINEELSKDPNDAALFNSQCWFIGTWQTALEDGEEACRLAVERGTDTAEALDSRAMYHLRVEELEKARTDIEEALRLRPSSAPSLLLRGLIKREQGDESAQSDISQALARRPSLGVQYERWGFELDE